MRPFSLPARARPRPAGWKYSATTTPRRARHLTSVSFFAPRPQDYPEGEVILGIELRMRLSQSRSRGHRERGRFQRPGDDRARGRLPESVREAVTKVIKHFNWKGPVGGRERDARHHARPGERVRVQAAGRDDARETGKVATMIHTEAAAYTEMYFGPGREANGWWWWSPSAKGSAR